MHHENRKPKRRPVVSGFILLALGLFLWSASLDALEHTWPVFIIIVGIAIILGSIYRRNRHEDSGPSLPPPPAPPPPPGR